MLRTYRIHQIRVGVTAAIHNTGLVYGTSDLAARAYTIASQRIIARERAARRRLAGVR